MLTMSCVSCSTTTNLSENAAVLAMRGSDCTSAGQSSGANWREHPAESSTMAGAGFTPTEWIWRDGKMVRWEDANIHVLSHVVHYGSSIFEGIRCYITPDGPAIFRLREHLRRFTDSAKIYRMDLPYSSETLAEACEKIVAANGLEECYLRPLAIRGYGSPGVNPLGCPVEVFVMCWCW